MDPANAYPTGILISYWDLMRSTWSAPEWGARFDAAGLRRPRLMIDSGVYTARQKNVAINAREYAAWLAAQQWQGQLVGAVDVDWPPRHDVVRTHTALLRRTLGPEKVLPVLHSYLRTSEIEEYCEQHSWCAVGGYGLGFVSGQLRELSWNTDASDRRYQWFEHCHAIASKYGTRLHALGHGCTGDVLNRWDWYSADASLISVCDRFGVVMLWHPRERRLRQYLGGVRSRPAVARRAADALAGARVSMGRALRDRTYRQGVSALAIAQMESYYAHRNLHGFRFFVAEKSHDKLIKAYRLAAGLVARREGIAT